jgi:hypothetical protein
MGNGDLVSWRGAVSLFDSILSLRFRCTLPLHVIRQIGTAALQRNDLVNHVSGTDLVRIRK